MEMTRASNGAIRINGKPIGMYQLCVWLSQYNQNNQTHIRPRDLTIEHIQKFLAAKKRGDWWKGK